MARLKTRYNDELKAQLQETLAVKNVMDIPRITKITINMGVGAAAADKKLLDGALADMQAIAGQKPVLTLARKSIAGFKIFSPSRVSLCRKNNQKRKSPQICSLGLIF